MSAAQHTPMVVAAARAICRLSAEACGIDNDDNWKIYGDGYVREAETVLSACGALEVLEALIRVDAALRAAWSAGNLPASVLPGELASMCGAAIAKATGGAA